MNVRKWNLDILKPLCMREKIKVNLNLSKEIKFLDMTKNLIKYSIKINLEPMFQSAKNNSTNKRHILKVIANLFDPIKYLEPLVVG